MKTFQEFCAEALKPSVVQAAARQQYTRQATQQQVSNRGTGNLPKQLSFTRVYHGTTQPASKAISQSGWRTDTNVTRQMQGAGVYTTPQRSAAQMYANQRANQRGESPAVRTFRLPSSTFDKVKTSRQQQGKWTLDKGGRKFNVMQMSPQGANKYDITDKLKGTINVQGSQRRELNQRVRTGLQRPQNVSALKRQIRSGRGSGSSSLSNVGSGSGNSHLTKDGRFRMNVGHKSGDRYGIGGVGLAD